MAGPGLRFSKKHGIIRCVGSLELSLSGNPLHCDEKMQWIKLGEQQGWINLHGWTIHHNYVPLHSALPPTCVNYPDLTWQNRILPGDTASKQFNHEMFI